MDKPQFFTSSTAVQSHSSMSLRQKSSSYSAWPFSLLMLLMLACMGSSACIIVISDGQADASWKVQPAVLLAIISSIWNYAAGTMIAIAVTVTWWRNFFRGTTVRNLHYIWKRGGGFSWASSFRAGVEARNIVLLASLIFLVQAFNNPLLQRSTHIIARNVTVADTMKLNIASPLPDGYLSRIVNATSANVIGSRQGMSVMQGLRWNAPMLTHNATGFRCDGVCKAKVQGTGFASTCNSTTTSLNFTSAESDGAFIFFVNSDLIYNETGLPIVVLKLFTPQPWMPPGSTVALDLENLDNMTVLSHYTSAGDLSTAVLNQGAGPLQSIQNEFGILKTHATLEVNPTTHNSIYSGGGISELFFKTNDSDYVPSIIHRCGLLFSSPTNYTLNYMHQFLFRAGFQNATDADTQTFPVERSKLQLIFQSNYHYLAVVLAAKMLVLIGLLSQVWAWWELRWNVSMSPMETASAIGAPVLQHGRGQEALDMLKKIGDMGVIYGEAVHNGRITHPMAQMQPGYY